jgi:hypothetical protein
MEPLASAAFADSSEVAFAAVEIPVAFAVEDTDTEVAFEDIAAEIAAEEVAIAVGAETDSASAASAAQTPIEPLAQLDSNPVVVVDSASSSTDFLPSHTPHLC